MEELPSTEEMADRIEHGHGLVGPELATLLSYTKIWLEQELLRTDLPDDPYVSERLTGYFPQPLRERFSDRMRTHRLHREIITTVAVNRFVNSSGLTACFRLCGETGAKVDDVVRAQLAARAVFRVSDHEQHLTTLDNIVAADVQTQVRLDLRELVERATRWFLRHRPAAPDVQATIDEFVDDVDEIVLNIGKWLGQHAARDMATRVEKYVAAGVPAGLARVAGAALFLPQALSAVQIAHRMSRPVALVTQVTTHLAEVLGLTTLQESIGRLPQQDPWDYLARAALRDDLLQTRSDLTAQALAAAPDADHPRAVITGWRKQIQGLVETRRTLSEVCDGEPDLARLSVGLRAVRSLLDAPR